MLRIEISNRQTAFEFDARRLKRAAEAILRDAGIASAALSIAVVDDPTIRRLNRQFLDHDEPTDVLSFVLEHERGHLEGEVIVSAQTALGSAARYGWSPEAELSLYVIHGTLHLVGYDDHTADQRAAMRGGERRYLALLGLEAREEPLADAPPPGEI
jgi:probable rRNA maturation factor